MGASLGRRMGVNDICNTELWAIRAKDERGFAIGKAQTGDREGALYFLGNEERWLSMYKGTRPDLLEAFGSEFKRIVNMAERVYNLKKTEPEYRHTG
jgi:hypothetical protein